MTSIAYIVLKGRTAPVPPPPSRTSLCFRVRQTELDNHRYPRQTYNMLRSLDEAGRTTWGTHIKALLLQFGFGYAWLANEVGNVREFTKLFETRVGECAL